MLGCMKAFKDLLEQLEVTPDCTVPCFGYLALVVMRLNGQPYVQIGPFGSVGTTQWVGLLPLMLQQIHSISCPVAAPKFAIINCLCRGLIASINL